MGTAVRKTALVTDLVEPGDHPVVVAEVTDVAFGPRRRRR